MNSLELKIPPPIVFLLCAGLAWSISKVLPSLTYPSTIITLSIAAFATVLGFAIAIAGAVHFHRAGTTIHPQNPQDTSAIVNTGVYSISRNPMYLGLLLVLVAVVVFFGNPVGAVCLAVFIGYITRFQILPEERVLESRFGDPYRVYLNRVRRWL